MITKIGQRRSDPGDLVDLLLECHERIRRFIGLAQALGERTDLPGAEVIETCARVERYFSVALPLHVRDEEDGVHPRLRGCSPQVDQALAAMHEQHADHEAKLRALLVALAALRGSPHDSTARQTLASISDELGRDFDEHLSLEEAVIFPAIRASLPASVQTQIVVELRARRE